MIDACWEKFTNKLAGLAFRFEVNPLSCGNPEHFVEYIRFCAISDNKAGRSVTHVLLNKEKEVIADPKAVPFYERMGFSPIRDYFHIPQDAANAKCVPMFMQLY